jgi:antitoxin (DNA-binding transcriptional repressor) of toxin-antitoxin stability system
MKTVELDDMAKDFTGYVRKVEGGEVFLIASHARPVAELRPVPTAADKQRPFGLCAGEFVVPDDFDAPLPDEVVDSFYPR